MNYYLDGYSNSLEISMIYYDLIIFATNLIINFYQYN